MLYLNKMQSSILYLTTLFLLHLTAGAGGEQCNPQDKKALLQIKKSFNSPIIFNSWSATTDCCADWYMVECDATNHRITSLTIDTYAPLSGSIPENSLANLPYLSTLVLRKLPNLTGPIPKSITKLENLQFLRLDWNSLTGPIPNNLHKLKQLNYINLSFNKLFGSIPPELALAPNLDFLRLDRNQLTGSIPNSLGFVKSGSLFRLDLSHNQLSGPIPRSLGKMNFTMLHLERNNLTGDASFLFGTTKPLNQIDLSRNRLEFNLSKAAAELPPRIGWVILDHNLIYGGLPDSMADLRYMNNLNVSYNRLCGRIPTGYIMSQFNMYSFYHNKCLCGVPLDACS